MKRTGLRPPLIARYVGRAQVDKEGVSVSVSDGFLKSFASSFLSTFGAGSLFVRTISDLFTLALARMLIEKGRLQESDPIALFSDEEALDVLKALTRTHPSLKVAFLQEPLGYGEARAIEQSFETLFGPSTFRPWLTAFESREFDSCRAISRHSS
jgi:hypothetical protein